MALQALIMPLVAVLKGSGFSQASKALRGLDGEFKNVAKSAATAAVSFAAAGALQNVTQYMDEAVAITQKYERNILALNQTFELQAAKMRQFTKDSAQMGISQSQAAQASVFLGSVLKQYGLEAEVTADETQKLIGLSQDLATTYGYDLQEALLAMTALFRGEYDPIEKFGVAMKQNEINALLAERGQSKLTGTMLFQAQVQARLDLLYQRSSDSMGAFERASGTLYQAQSKLNAALENQQIAFGTPLQKPLAEATDLFAGFAVTLEPVMEKLGVGLADALDGSMPLLEILGDSLVTLMELLPPLVEGFANFAIFIGDTAENISVLTTNIEELVALAAAPEIETTPTERAISKLALEQRNLQTAIEDGYAAYGTYESVLEDVNKALLEKKFIQGDGSEEKRYAVLLERSTASMSEFRKIQAMMNYESDEFVDNLKRMGIYAVDSEGKLTGLAAVFSTIEENAQKSQAYAELQKIGFAAAQIEIILADANWKQLFGQISTYARLAAIDISKIPAAAQYAAGVGIANAQKIVDEAIAGLGLSWKPEEAAKGAKETVETIFDTLKEETLKQTIKIKLGLKGASEGLIALILGRDDWYQLWLQIKQGIISLDGLQDSFNKTADGVKELEDALQDARDEAQAYIDKMQAEADRLYDIWQAAIKQAEAYKKSIAEIASIDILPTLEPEIGKFESQIITTFENIRAELTRGLDENTIYDDAYNSLLDYANKEAALLQGISRQRDDLANRYSLSEALIEEYKGALTSALSLTSLFSAIKTETEKRTVTEVSNSVIQLSGSLKEFNLTVSRSYEETVDKVIDKSATMLDGFRNMAAKARAFAENLRTLRDMGLDPMLFNQLVSAGVEAGGETAQALVEGGSETINEINGLFSEINSLGADLGEEVATTLYGAGIDMADGLLEGIRSQQSAMEELARSMAEAFNKEFNARVDVATQAPVQAAKEAYQQAQAAVPKMNEIDVQALADLNKLISGATRYIGNVSGALAEGGTTKLGVYEQLKQDVLSGAQLDLSGIKSGLSSAELITAAQATGSTTVTNNYSFQVAADTRTGGTQAGEAAIVAMQKFTQTNGSRAVVSLLGN